MSNRIDEATDEPATLTSQTRHNGLVIALAFTLVMMFGAAASASSRISLAGHHPSWANAANDRGVIPNQTHGHFTIQLARSAERQAAFAALLAAQYTPGSPEYHHWLTPAQIGERFGANDADIAAVTSWLRDAGFTVVHVGNTKTFVEVAGTADVASRAFGVEFHRYAVEGSMLTAIDREPTIPAGLGSIVTSVHGLHQSNATPMNVSGDSRYPHDDAGTGNGKHAIGVADFATIYDLGPVSILLSGQGMTIGIIGRARVWPDDITNFGLLEGVTMPVPAVVVPDTGMDPGPPCGDSSCKGWASVPDQTEATLDVERAGSIAPGAALQLIIAAKEDVGEDGADIALQFAIENRTADILNLSFSKCEATHNANNATWYESRYQTASMLGQSVFVSTGDAGAAGCQAAWAKQDTTNKTDASINLMGASGYVTAMGGTKFADQATQSTYWSGGAAVSYIPEGAWNDPVYRGVYAQLGGGGGESLYTTQPSFQSDYRLASSKRLVPDVSFASSSGEGYVDCLAMYGYDCAADTNYKYNLSGGTSAASPDMAGVAALIGEASGGPPGNLNPLLYELASDPANGAFHDVTVASSGVGNCDVTVPSLCNNTTPGPDGLSGGTQGFLVADGYDEATGLGSLDISQLIENWPGTSDLFPPKLTLNPTSLTLSDGQSGSVTLSATGLGLPTFACSDLPSGATCAFTGNTLTITIGGTAAGITAGSSSPRRSMAWLALPLGFAVLASRRRRRPRPFALLLFALTAMASCDVGSDGPSGGHLLSERSVTITATSPSGSATASLSLL
jgi:subtilase family serine protease